MPPRGERLGLQATHFEGYARRGAPHKPLLMEVWGPEVGVSTPSAGLKKVVQNHTNVLAISMALVLTPASAAPLTNSPTTTWFRLWPSRTAH